MILIKKLYQINILKPKGFTFLLQAIFQNGINLMAVLQFVTKLNPESKAIIFNEQILSYKTLYLNSKMLAFALKRDYNVQPNQNVGIFCRNNSVAVHSLFALSNLGVNIYFINTEISQNQLSELLRSKKINLLIYDKNLQHKIDKNEIKSIDSSQIFNLISSVNETVKLPKQKGRDIVILSGGTTGKPKSAKRKPSIGSFLNPLVALLSQLNLNQYKSVYIATPFYHGFGLASLIMSVLLGSEIYLLEKFDAKKACKMIESNKVEVVTLVPIMLKRMTAENVNNLMSIKRVICGGAKLDQELVKQTLNQLGDVLYNLYGTTEAGFSILATPNHLKTNPLTIGMPIRGVTVKIVDSNGVEQKVNEIGQVHLKNGWSMNNTNENYINTDDLGFVNVNGLVFLAGRNDNMIISGGENVYPDEIENILIKHESIDEVAVVGVPDKEFGQRLVAYIVLIESSIFNEIECIDWLKNRAARYQIPKNIIQMDELPRTAIGKVDKKRLKTKNIDSFIKK